MKSKKVIMRSLIPVLIAVGIVLFSNAIVITQHNEYKIIREFGKIVKIVDMSGMSLKIPFIQTTQSLPKNVQLYDLPISDVITKDKKTMVCDSFVLWKITDVQKFVKSLSGQISNAEARINTIVYNSVKNVISSLTR